MVVAVVCHFVHIQPNSIDMDCWIQMIQCKAKKFFRIWIKIINSERLSGPLIANIRLIKLGVFNKNLFFSSLFVSKHLWIVFDYRLHNHNKLYLLFFKEPIGLFLRKGCLIDLKIFDAIVKNSNISPEH